MYLGAKGDNVNNERHQEGLSPEKEVRNLKDFGKFKDLSNLNVCMGCII
jgi:hypothetical protein